MQSLAAAKPKPLPGRGGDFMVSNHDVLTLLALDLQAQRKRRRSMTPAANSDPSTMVPI
jgi:hypothetical protein